jgi:hypothetical protein
MMTNFKVSDNHKWSNWDQLELCHLKYAIAVNDQQGFTNAAAYLEVSVIPTVATIYYYLFMFRN